MIALFRFDSGPDGEESFLASARAVLAVLRDRPGYRRGWLGRAADEPTEWVLGTEWEGAGSYRRALSSVEVRADAGRFLSTARNEATAFEVVVADEQGGHR
ncbi:MAG TPA: antibiotic biosynthesis monooxygenase [Mycobacteriales bacterium]|nr:antibiotic biosynthesis monooxygenase [Mycobacteriales bacterium]